MEERTPVEGFLPGDLIKEELEARGWTQEDLAEILGRTPTSINEIITGKRGITVDSAKGIAEAFGTSAQFWLNMESAYRLSLEKDKPESVSRRAFLYNIAPVRAMIKRNWIEPSTNVGVLEQRLREFFGTSDLSHIPKLTCTARKSTAELTLEQRAWLFRVKNFAQAIQVEKHSKNRLNIALDKLKKMLLDEADIRLIPKVLADAGIKLLIVEPLPQSKIDGVSFWVNGTPVIALSLRFDRIDSFWHTLMHEIGHIKNEDGLANNSMILDTNLFEELDEENVCEKKADDFAVNFLVPQKDLSNFIIRIQPLYSKVKIIGFAKKVEVNPGIVVGQLQHRGRAKGGIDYSNFREMLIKIRHLIVNATLTDGYGQILSLDLN